MSKWVVEAISLAYEATGHPSSLAVRAHSTRSMAVSKALLLGVSLHDMWDVAGWSSPHTYVRLYYLDLGSTSGSRVHTEQTFAIMGIVFPKHLSFLSVSIWLNL